MRMGWYPALTPLMLLLVTSAAGERHQLEPQGVSPALVSKKSPHSFDQTLARLDSVVRVTGATVFAKIDHAAGASQAGMSLRPTTLLVFGNPKVGTPLMQQAQTLGVDLPLRVLVWQDEGGQVWLTYRDPGSLGRDHGMAADDALLGALAGALQRLTDAAARP